MKRIVGAAAIGAAVLGMSYAAAQAVAFGTRLSTVPVDPATVASITGQGRARATLDGRRLAVSGAFEGLQTPANAARLHLGAATGVRGPAIHDLEVARAREGSVDGQLTLSAREVEALRAGRLYIQIDSEGAPEGNLWGWLISEGS